MAYYGILWDGMDLGHHSLQGGELEGGQELKHLLLLEVASVAHDLGLLELVLAPHSLLYGPLLVGNLRGLVLLHQSLQLLQIQVVRTGDDPEEEQVVDKQHCLVSFLHRAIITTRGIRLVLMFEK